MSEPRTWNPTRWPIMNIGVAETGRPPLKCAMLVFEGLTLLHLIGPQTVLCGPIDTMLVGKTTDVIHSDTGVSIRASHRFADVPTDVDIVFAPGGPGQCDVMRDDEALAFLADRGSRAQYVTSVCSGSLILGAAGLLRGYKATTHWAALDALAIFGAEPVAQRVVIDRNRITGGGVTAGIDFGLTLLATMFGERNAKITQLAMEYQPEPPFNAGAPHLVDESIVADALRIMSGASRETMEVLAKFAGAA